MLFRSPQGKASNFPIKTSKIKIRTRHLEYFFITHKKNTFIQKRIEKDIWKNLYQLPLLEFPEKTTPQIVLKRFVAELIKTSGKNFEVKKTSTHKKHQLSHQTILARFWHINLTKEPILPDYKKISLKSLKKYPFPVLIDNHLQEITIFE